MSRSRMHDVLFLLGVLVPACGPGKGGDDGPEGGEDLEGAVEACGPFARNLSGCDVDEDYGYLQSVGYCISSLGYAEAYGPDCRTAFEDYYACLANVECGEIFGGGDELEGGGDPGDTPCAAESLALEQQCGWDDSFDEGEDAPPDPSADGGEVGSDGADVTTDGGETTTDGGETTTGTDDGTTGTDGGTTGG